ncbi:MAG: ABC transporter substrate-binding protein, partial [Cyanobacteria bacterium P01_C01_bin.118]
MSLRFLTQTALLLASSTAIALGLASCTTPPTSEADSADATDTEVSETSEDSLQVVTTILPITQFTTAVAGDRAEVVQLLPTNVGP